MCAVIYICVYICFMRVFGFDYVHTMCSQKCASPGLSFGSCDAPTRTLRAAAAFSVVGSETTMALRLLGNLLLLLMCVCVCESVYISNIYFIIKKEKKHSPKHLPQHTILSIILRTNLQPFFLLLPQMLRIAQQGRPSPCGGGKGPAAM